MDLDTELELEGLTRDEVVSDVKEAILEHGGVMEGMMVVLGYMPLSDGDVRKIFTEEVGCGPDKWFADNG